MTIYKVAYDPEISQETRKEIAENIEYSMESINGDTYMYPLLNIIDAKWLNIPEKDRDYLQTLNNDGVDYIEFR